MKLLTVFTTLIIILLLHSCAFNRYQKIPSQELEQYHKTRAGCGLTPQMRIEFQNIELDKRKKQIKINGRVLDEGPQDILIPGANVSIIEGDSRENLIKKQISTDIEGRFGLTATIGHNDRLEFTMIGYKSEFYELGKLLSSKKK